MPRKRMANPMNAACGPDGAEGSGGAGAPVEWPHIVHF